MRKVWVRVGKRLREKERGERDEGERRERYGRDEGERARSKGRVGCVNRFGHKNRMKNYSHGRHSIYYEFCVRLFSIINFVTESNDIYRQTMLLNAEEKRKCLYTLRLSCRLVIFFFSFPSFADCFRCRFFFGITISCMMRISHDCDFMFDQWLHIHKINNY